MKRLTLLVVFLTLLGCQPDGDGDDTWVELDSTLQAIVHSKEDGVLRLSWYQTAYAEDSLLQEEFLQAQVGNEYIRTLTKHPYKYDGYYWIALFRDTATEAFAYSDTLFLSDGCPIPPQAAFEDTIYLSSGIWQCWKVEDKSLYQPTRRLWIWGDGSEFDPWDTCLIALHDYYCLERDTTYLLQLIVWNVSGCDTASKPIFIPKREQ